MIGDLWIRMGRLGGRLHRSLNRLVVWYVDAPSLTLPYLTVFGHDDYLAMITTVVASGEMAYSIPSLI